MNASACTTSQTHGKSCPRFEVLDISIILDIIKCMDPIEVFKALSNESRLQILHWLKEPEKHFTPHEGVDMRKTGYASAR